MTREEVIEQVRALPDGKDITSLSLLSSTGVLHFETEDTAAMRKRRVALEQMGDVVSIHIMSRALSAHAMATRPESFPRISDFPCAQMVEGTNSVMLDPAGDRYAQLRQILLEYRIGALP